MREGTFLPRDGFIRQLRKRQGLTQEKLALRIGCAKGTVERLEKGKPAIMRTFKEAAIALNHSPATDLINWNAEKSEGITARFENKELLIEILFVSRPEKLLSLLNNHSYAYRTMVDVRELVRTSRFPDKILAFASSIVWDKDLWNTSPDAVAILSNLLTTCHALWRPKPTVLTKLEFRCREVMRLEFLDHFQRAGLLAFGLGRKGKWTCQESYLKLMIEDDDFRKADATAMAKYYGPLPFQLIAIRRHVLEDRPGLLGGNVIPALMNLISNPALQKPTIRKILDGWLTKAAKAIDDYGEASCLRKVQGFIKKWR